MSMPIVHHLRLAFIWVETTLELIRDPVPARPFAFLGSDATYVPRFDNLQRGQPDPDRLTLPWPKPAGQRFWTYYLGRRPGNVSGGKAWGALVPLRLKLDLSITAPWLPGRGSAEGYFYPHGHALVVTFELASVSLPLTDSVDLARDVRKRKKLVVARSTQQSEELTLDALADSALTMLRELALGKGAAAGAITLDPFSIVTFVAVEGIDPTEALNDGGDIHRALEAVTGWQANPPAKLPPMKDNVLKPDAAPDVVYAKRRGRAVWFPTPATKPGIHQTLGCYSRNLLYASLQLESLAQLVVETDQRGFISDTHRDLARYAGGLMGRIYGGKETYRSISCRVQMEQNDWLDPTDSVRTRFPPMTKLQRLNAAGASAPGPGR